MSERPPGDAITMASVEPSGATTAARVDGSSATRGEETRVVAKRSRGFSSTNSPVTIGTTRPSAVSVGPSAGRAPSEGVKNRRPLPRSKTWIMLSRKAKYTYRYGAKDFHGADAFCRIHWSKSLAESDAARPSATFALMSSLAAKNVMAS